MQNKMSVPTPEDTPPAPKTTAPAPDQPPNIPDKSIKRTLTRQFAHSIQRTTSPDRSDESDTSSPPHAVPAPPAAPALIEPASSITGITSTRYNPVTDQVQFIPARTTELAETWKSALDGRNATQYPGATAFLEPQGESTGAAGNRQGRKRRWFGSIRRRDRDSAVAGMG